MTHDTDTLSERFLPVALGAVTYAWTVYAFAAAGVFSRPVILTSSILLLAGFAFLFFRALRVASPLAKTVVVAATLYAAVVLHGATPTVFSGRDQGSIAEAAIAISSTGSISYRTEAAEPFFAIYGPGRALNFPGFFYGADGSLRSQFPLSYEAWLAAFHSLFGLGGLAVANGILLALSLVSIFMLVRLLSDEVSGAGAFAIAAVSFLPIWFSKSTLSENLGLFLFLFLAYALVQFLRQPSVTALIAVTATGTLLSVTRIEGVAILALAAVVVTLNDSSRSWLMKRPLLLRLTPVAVTFLLILTDVALNARRYGLIAKAFLGNVAAGDAASSLIAEKTGTAAALWHLFVPYGILPIVIAGIAGIGILVLRKAGRHSLVPVLLALPTFLYLIDPNITGDHPWMLRRLLFSVWPSLLVTAAIAIPYSIPARRSGVRMAAFALLAALSLPPTLRVFAFSEHPALLRETETLASSIGPRDLLLIDRSATGDPFAIPAAPLRLLFGKNAVYCFNPDDIGRIPEGRYDRVYLLAPIDNLGHWAQVLTDLSTARSFTFHTERFGPLPLSDARLPETVPVETESLLIRLDQTL